jgi:hypothetical protein
MSSHSASKQTFLTDAHRYIYPMLTSTSLLTATRESALYLNPDGSPDFIFQRFKSSIKSHSSFTPFDTSQPFDPRQLLSVWSTHPSIHSHGYMFHLYEVYSYGPFFVYIASPTRIDIHFAIDSPHWPIFSVHPHTLLAIQLIVQPLQYEVPITFLPSTFSPRHQSLAASIQPLLQCFIDPLLPVPSMTVTSLRVPPPPLVRPTPTFYSIRAHHVTTLLTYLRQHLNVSRLQSSAFESLISGNIDIQPLWTRQGFYESYFKISISYSNFYTCIHQFQTSPNVQATFTELKPLIPYVPELRNIIIDDLLRSVTSCFCAKRTLVMSAYHCDKIYLSPPCFQPLSDHQSDCIIYGIIATKSKASSYPRKFPFSETNHAATVYCFSLKHYSQPDTATYPCYSDQRTITNRSNPISAILKRLTSRAFPQLCNPQLRMYI